MLTSRKNLIIAFFSVLIVAFALNELNINFIRNQADKSNEFLNKELSFNQTVSSIDNCWYLPQIKNYLAGKGFTCDTSDSKLAVRRTPVYPLFYGLHYVLFGEKNSFFFIKITQTFLFALSAIAFLLAVFYLTNNKKTAWLAFALYGFNPTLISYTYFTLTESLSPALVGFMLYFFSKGVKNNSFKDWFLAGLSFSIASLCRPTIFIFGASITFAIIYINRKNIKKIVTDSLAVGLAVCMIFVPYVIRNYKVTNGDFVLLEKYYNDPMNYGMQNIEFRHWIASWMNPSDYNSERISNKMSTCIRFHGEKTPLIDSLIATIPPRVYESYDKKTVRDIYESLYSCYQYKFWDTIGKNIDSVNNLTVDYIHSQTDSFVKKNPVKYYVLTPLLFLKSIIIQSNSATLTYLDNYTSNKMAYLFKLLLVLLNVYLFFAFAGNLLYIRKYFFVYTILFLFIVINCGYILIGLRYFETRYLVPPFPFLYISGAIFAVETYDRIKQKLNL